MKIVVILGSTRTKFRLGERVAKWVMNETKKYFKAEFTLLDLREYNLPFFDEEEGPRGNKDRHPAENVKRWIDDIASGDGYIFITPEYNEGPSAALKNAIDFIRHEADRKPAVFIGYSDGANGGMYAPMQLRVNVSEVGMVALKTQQIILSAQKKLNEEGVAQAEHKESLEKRFARLATEIIWFTDTLKTAREKNS